MTAAPCDRDASARARRQRRIRDRRGDGAFPDVGLARHQFVARNGLAGAAGKDRQDFLLAVRQLQGLAAALQLALGDLERVGPEDQLLDLRRGPLYTSPIPRDRTTSRRHAYA